MPDYRLYFLGPDAAIRLHVSGVSPGTVALTLGLPRYAPLPSVPVTVEVAVAAPRVVDVPRGGSRTLVLPLPAGAEADEVTFRTPVSFVPAELGMGADRRRLAVQLLGVERHAS